MGFSLKRAGLGVATGGLSEVFRALSPGQVNAPQMGAPPQLNEYGAYPDFSPQEQAYLQQQQQALQQYQAMLSQQQQPNGYQQSSDQAAALENQNYITALNQAQGTLNTGQQQQQKKDFANLVQSAGARGIRILGDDPMNATSDSTAGNQILSDFNQRYQTLADQNRQAQLQMGYGQNIGRMGFNQSQQQANYGNILNLQTAYGNLMQPYQQQRLGAYGTQNANVDVRNQGLLNNYQSAYNQQMMNYQANAQNQANRMGFINSLVGLGGTIGGAVVGGAPGAAAGGQIGRSITPQANYGNNMGFGYGTPASGNRLSLY